MTDPRLHGLYVITDGRSPTTEDLVKRVRQAIAGGARIVQYRDKRPEDRAQRRERARALSRLCRSEGVVFIVNDDVALASESEAHGVHLGRDDPDPDRARAVLGSGAIIGVSCYNDLRRGLRFADRGVDYVAYGRFFPSRTKPGAVAASVRLLEASRGHLDIPIAAIGGVTADNGGELVRAGADMLAVIEAAFAQPNVTEACRGFEACFRVPRQGSLD